MYLYNVTIIAETGLGEEIKTHIGTHFFSKPIAVPSISLLEMQDSPHEGITYCVQLLAKDHADITTFQQQHLRILQEYLTEQYPGKVLFFDSVMKYLNVK